MKKIVVYFTFIALLLIFTTSAFAEEKQREDYTFGEIEQMIINYLKENNYDFEIGTPEFTDYVLNQMDYDADKKLASLKDYHLYVAYFSEYLYRLSLFETELAEEKDLLELAKSSNETLLSVSGVTFSMASLKDKTIGDIEKEVALEEALNQILRINNKLTNVVSTNAVNTINLSAARQYASKYYNTYNPNYPRFSNDCTNFVSQILFAGGRSMVSGPIKTLVSDTKYWFIKKRPDNTWSRSTSWTVVTDLFSHLTRTQPTTASISKMGIHSYAKAGDVIQFKKEGATRYSHCMWVYSKTSNDLLLSGHTNPALQKSFNGITGYYLYRVIRM
jgi:hypothetical protein